LLQELAQHFMGGRGEKTQAQGGEALAGDRQEGGGGLMGAAQSFLGQHMGGETGTTGSQEGASHQTGGGGLAGMAQQFLGGHSGAEGEGAKRGGASGLMGAAAAFMGGGSSEGGAVGASTAEGAGKMDVGIVDKLLSMYSMTHGKKVSCLGVLG
jgi:hypothetical protein